MLETEPTMNPDAPKCPHCQAVQKNPLGTQRTIKVHPCQTCGLTFVVSDTTMVYTTIQTIFPSEEPGVLE